MRANVARKKSEINSAIVSNLAKNIGKVKVGEGNSFCYSLMFTYKYES